MPININQMLEYEGVVDVSDTFAVESVAEGTVKCPFNQLITAPAGFVYPNISYFHIDIPVGGNRDILTTELNSFVTVSNDVEGGTITLPDMTGLDDGYAILIAVKVKTERIDIKNNSGTTLFTLVSFDSYALLLNNGTSWIILSEER